MALGAEAETCLSDSKAIAKGRVVRQPFACGLSSSRLITLDLLKWQSFTTGGTVL